MWKKGQELSGVLSPAGQDTTESVIGPSVHLEGNFNSSGNIVIGGSLTGSLTTSGDVRIAEGAKVQATVSATHIYVSGEVRGDVIASELLELSPTARLYGNVEAKILSVTPGAVLHGKCAMRAGKGEKIEVRSEKSESRAKQTAKIVSETE